MLYRALGLIPERYFDVQVAAGILGFHYPMNLETLTKTFTDEQISKGVAHGLVATPVEREPIKYAIQDSELIAIYQTVCPTSRTTKEEWAWAASEELLSNALKPNYAGLDWLEWNVAGSLDLPTQRVLTRLLMLGEKNWRNERTNHPSICCLEVLRCISPNKDPAAWSNQNRRINRHFLKKYGKEVIESSKKAFVIQTPSPFSRNKKRPWSLCCARGHSSCLKR